MSRYSVPERIAFVKAYYAGNNISTAAQRKFATEFKLKQTNPSGLTIKNLIRKFERTINVRDDSFGNVGHQKSVKTSRRHALCFKPASGSRSDELHNNLKTLRHSSHKKFKPISNQPWNSGCVSPTLLSTEWLGLATKSTFSFGWVRQ
ncbi:hypothetical protein TNIN_458171 [Trichonephila inaurata madagascariensis]|uniref:DUF4817 domain-containing protein n=1 Tax=Trichonephila inaurata madagascariensis TaxID=2747483 RepID=A0A8X7CC30_9ARAC|nr:hypothetical protein TNIN_458171 [Trichonephila inaurata madagascariensis]